MTKMKVKTHSVPLDDTLYSIGLCHTSVRDIPKRKAIDKPVVITGVTVLFMFQRIACLFTDDNQLLMYLGDVGRYYGIKLHVNTLLILSCLIILMSQLNYYYNYKHGI